MKNKKKGFTLVELIVLIVILAILIGVSIGGLYLWVNKSRVSTDINNASAMQKSLETLSVDENICSIARNNKGTADSPKLIYKQEWSNSEPISNEVSDSSTIDPTDIIDNKIGDILVDGLPSIKSDGKFVLEITSDINGDIDRVICKIASGTDNSSESGGGTSGSGDDDQDDCSKSHSFRTETIAVSLNNTSNGTYSFVKDTGNKWISNNKGIDDSTATSTWTLDVKNKVSYSIRYKVSCEEGFDKFTLSLDSINIASSMSGENDNELTYDCELTKGVHTIVATYTKDSSDSGGDDLSYVILPEAEDCKLVCDKCGFEHLEHEYGETVVVKQPTCKDTGESKTTCTVCGYEKLVTLNALSHNYVDDTCTVCGSELAGLFDADNNLLASWEESGIDISIDYNLNSYEAIKTSVYYVITNKYPNTKKVVIPNKVTNIGNYAFQYCSSLTSIVVPDSVKTIGVGIFYSCSGLNSIVIPDSISIINDDIFYNCKNLTSVTIPNSVTRIGNGLFYGCSSLTSVVIPNSVTSLGHYDFYKCSSLTSVTLSSNITSLGYQSFYNCSKLASVTIPDSVTSIGGYAFKGCTSLTSINIPDSVTSIGYYAFADCSSLTSISIPDSVTNINNGAFYKVPHIYYSGSATGSPWGAKAIN